MDALPVAGKLAQQKHAALVQDIVLCVRGAQAVQETAQVVEVRALIIVQEVVEANVKVVQVAQVRVRDVVMAARIIAQAVRAHVQATVMAAQEAAQAVRAHVQVTVMDAHLVMAVREAAQVAKHAEVVLGAVGPVAAVAILDVQERAKHLVILRAVQIVTKHVLANLQPYTSNIMEGKRMKITLKNKTEKEILRFQESYRYDGDNTGESFSTTAIICFDNTHTMDELKQFFNNSSNISDFVVTTDNGKTAEYTTYVRLKDIIHNISNYTDEYQVTLAQE